MKNKILVLTESKKSIRNTLASTINLAKIIKGDIKLFSIKDPSEVVKEDNQLSAIRELNYEYISGNNELESLAKSAKEEFDVTLTYSFVIGQYKSEVKKFISEYQPDVIVISKGKSSIFNLTRNKLADFVINSFSGPILVTDDDEIFKENESLSLGVFNNTNKQADRSILERLVESTEKPIKSFKIVDPKNKEELGTTNFDNAIEYVFEQNDNAIYTLTNYLEKNGVNLLYLDRENLKREKRKKIMKSVKVPLLLSKKR